MAERDKKDPRYNYAELLSRADPRLVEEITPEKKAERYEACQAAIRKLRGIVEHAKADVVVVISNAHGVLPDDSMPVFGVFRGSVLTERDRGAPVESDPRMASYRGPAAVVTSRPPREARSYAAHPELAAHLLDSLIDEGFDVASSLELRKEHGLDEAFQAYYELYDPACRTPMLPFFLSRYLPSQASPRRCYAMGAALRRAIESWDSEARVALMASGGLSHQIIDQELDEIVANALINGDAGTLCSLSRERLNRAPGTPEILNWIAVAAAMDPNHMKLIDYVPCYRSPAGTGHGVTFGYWPAA
jgi:hypothetical protein